MMRILLAVTFTIAGAVLSIGCDQAEDTPSDTPQPNAERTPAPGDNPLGGKAPPKNPLFGDKTPKTPGGDVPTTRNAALLMDWPMVDRLTKATEKPAHIALSQSMARAIP